MVGGRGTTMLQLMTIASRSAVFLLGAFASFLAAGCAAAEVPDDGAPAASEDASQDLRARPKTTYCDAIQRVTVSNGSLEVGADGIWSPGENAIIDLTLTNEGNADDQLALTAYPGIRITFDPPVASVTVASGPDDDIVASTGTLRPNTPTVVRFRIAANADVAPGTRVTVSAAMADNRSPFNHCQADGPKLTFGAVIGG
jgi:hypothetical protein